MTIETAVPQRVTRFYGKTEFALDLIENKLITFVHASTLNDPFDPYCFFETDFGDNYVNLLEYVRKRHPEDMPWFRAHVTPQSWGQTVIDIKAHLRRVRDTTFVLSTSAAHAALEPKDNLYMWGHYAQGHRGIAIEFDTHALERAVRAQHESENGQPVEATDIWVKMEYAKSFAPITAEHVHAFMKQQNDLERPGTVPRTTELEAYYNRMSTIKSDVWRNENEWRLMWRSEGDDRKFYKCPIQADAIVNIFLGLNLAEQYVEEIGSVGRRNFPGVPILRAQKRHGDLALEFHSI